MQLDAGKYDDVELALKIAEKETENRLKKGAHILWKVYFNSQPISYSFTLKYNYNFLDKQAQALMLGQFEPVLGLLYLTTVTLL